MERPSKLSLAIQELLAGGVVAFPTETVYGLGADASNPRAIAQIFNIKGRPPDHPLIVHIPGADQLSRWTHETPEDAYLLAELFWPGPLTLILPRSKAPPEVTGGQTNVGLRAPRHPVAQELLRGFGGGIAAPSANRFGRISPTRADHVRDELGDRISLILEGGDCEVGLESTILSLTGPTPCLLRPGAISRTQLEDVLKRPIHGAEEAPGLRASGLLASHYSPRTPFLLTPSEGEIAEPRFTSLRTALMCISDRPTAASVHRVQMPKSPADYGARLYATLRELDQGQFDLIMAETPPTGEAWLAVHDRLRRASHDTQVAHSIPADTR